ncbi:hypothetical protein ES705_48775 [subsurface metagenome]
MHELIVEKYGNFKLKTFDTNEEFSRDERITAEQIISIMEKLLGKFTLDKKLTGEVYPLGRFVFKTASWTGLKNSVYGWNSDTDVEKHPLAGLIPNKNAKVEEKIRYLIDRIIAPLKIDLITTNNRDRKFITVNALPSGVWMPQDFEAPFELDPDSVREYYANQGYKLFGLVKDINDRKDRTYTKNTEVLGLGVLSRALYRSISGSGKFSRSELIYVAANTIRTVIHSNLNVRGNLFDWILTRGGKTLTFEIKGTSSVDKITLTPDDFKRYFEQDYKTLIKLIDNYVVSAKELKAFFADQLRNQFKVNEEYYTNVFEYIYTAWEKVYPNPSNDPENAHRLIFYPFIALPDGYSDISSLQDELLMPHILVLI